MNLSEMSKKKGVLPAETTQQMPILHDTIDKWRKLLQEQAEALSKVKTERDRLLEIQRKDQENIQKYLERMRELRENLQKISSENQKLQDELQKLTEENQKLQTELSRTQNINQSLQRSNDDLRNRNGLRSRKEQEQLEEKIRDVQDRNSKLEKMVALSSVEAVEAAQKKQQEAEKREQLAKCMEESEKKKAEKEMRIVKKQAEKRIEKIKKKEILWRIGYVMILLLAIMKNRVLQNDLVDLVRVPVNQMLDFENWLLYPTYENILGQKVAYVGGEVWVIRIISVIAFLLAILIAKRGVLRIIEKYKKTWDVYSFGFLVFSISFIVMTGDFVREYIPINLLIIFWGVSIGQMLFRNYIRKKQKFD